MEGVGRSCRGKSREKNEDSYLVDFKNEIGLFAVADGMGGHVAGELASSLAIETLVDFAQDVKKGSVNISSPLDENMLGEVVLSLFEKANQNIRSRVQDHPAYQGMGTTLTLALCIDDKVILGNIGDSRCYLIKEDDIVLLTEDHSLVNHLLKKGEITQQQAVNHPQKHVLTRALGTEDEIQVDIFFPHVRRSEYLLLCTDGLTSLVTPAEIHRTLLEEPPLERSAKLLVDLANNRGGYDNITLVIAKGAGI